MVAAVVWKNLLRLFSFPGDPAVAIRSVTGGGEPRKWALHIELLWVTGLDPERAWQRVKHWLGYNRIQLPPPTEAGFSIQEYSQVAGVLTLLGSLDPTELHRITHFIWSICSELEVALDLD